MLLFSSHWARKDKDGREELSNAFDAQIEVNEWHTIKRLEE
jgi:hypothetical protein